MGRRAGRQIGTTRFVSVGRRGLVEAEPRSEGSRIPPALTPTQICIHGAFRPNRMLAAAPWNVWQANRRGTVLGASRVWHTKNLAPNIRSGTRSTRHAECNAPPFGRAPHQRQSLTNPQSRAAPYPCTVTCRCSPNRSTPNLTTWPGCKKTGGFMPIPTPGGVPVAITSPGSRVKIRLR